MSFKKTYDDDYQESEFNMGFGTIDRLNNTLDRVNLFFSLKQYEHAFKQLQVVYSEVYAFLKEDERDEEDRTEAELITSIKKKFVVQGSNKILRPDQDLDNELRKWDRKLRVLLLKYKLYMKMQDSRLAAMKV